MSLAVKHIQAQLQVYDVKNYYLTSQVQGARACTTLTLHAHGTNTSCTHDIHYTALYIYIENES
jgi:hypothetical protein